MNTAVIVIIFIVALCISVGFLVLVLTLVPAIHQFRALLADLEKTSSEVRDLSRQVRKLGVLAEEKMEKVDHVLDSSKRTVQGVADTLHFVNANLLRRTAGLITLIPAVKFGWKLMRKIKGGHK